MQHSIKLTILGSGTCVPSLKRSSCSFFVETADAGLLFDIGAGTMRRLLEAGIHINQVTHICISHLHPDHTGELVSFLFSSKYPTLLRENNPLTIIAGKGFKAFFSQLKKAYGSWIDFAPDIFSIVEMDTEKTDRFSLNSTRLTTSPVKHNPESIAFRLENNQKSVTYSGDTDYCSSLIEFSRETDLFICESAMPDSLKVENHLSPSAAGKIATEAGVKKMILTHFYPECDKTDIAKECRRTYDGELVLAEDLMELTL